MYHRKWILLAAVAVFVLVFTLTWIGGVNKDSNLFASSVLGSLASLLVLGFGRVAFPRLATHHAESPCVLPTGSSQGAVGADTHGLQVKGTPPFLSADVYPDPDNTAPSIFLIPPAAPVRGVTLDRAGGVTTLEVKLVSEEYRTGLGGTSYVTWEESGSSVEATLAGDVGQPMKDIGDIISELNSASTDYTATAEFQWASSPSNGQIVITITLCCQDCGAPYESVFDLGYSC